MFSSKLKIKLNTTKICNISGGTCSVSRIIHIGRLFKKIYILVLIYLKLEIGQQFQLQMNEKYPQEIQQHKG